MTVLAKEMRMESNENKTALANRQCSKINTLALSAPTQRINQQESPDPSEDYNNNNIKYFIIIILLLFLSI